MFEFLIHAIFSWKKDHFLKNHANYDQLDSKQPVMMFSGSSVFVIMPKTMTPPLKREKSELKKSL